MSIIEPLEKNILNLWMPNSSRSRYNDFKPVFQVYAGLQPNEEQSYSNICKQIEINQNKYNKNTVLIQNGCIFQTDPKMLKAIAQELEKADLDHLTADNIVMYENPQMNEMFLKALSSTLNLRRQAGYMTRKQEENFILSLLVLYAKYGLPVQFESTMYGKMVYYNPYGTNMAERDLWLLLLAYFMTFDVLVLSPKGFPEKESPVWNYAEIFNDSPLSSALPFEEYASKGQGINKIITHTALAASQLKQNMFNNETRVFNDWQLRNAKTKSITIDGTIEDLDAMWDKQSRTRDGFYVNPEQTEISLPVFFWEFDGVNDIQSDYSNLVFSYQKIRDPDMLFVASNPDELTGPFKKEHAGELIFCMNSNGTYSYEKLKNAPNNSLSKVSEESARRITDIFNQLILSHQITDKKLTVSLGDMIFNIPADILRMIENYDYPKGVPKIILFLENEQKLNELQSLVLEFYHMCGFDILLFAPSGISGLDSRSIHKERLTKMVNNQKFPVPVFTEPYAQSAAEKFLLFGRNKKKNK